MACRDSPAQRPSPNTHHDMAASRLTANMLRLSPCWSQAEDANREMLELLADFLPKRFPDRFSMDGTVLINHALSDRWDLADKSLNPLDVSAQLVQVSSLCVCLYKPLLLAPMYQRVPADWQARSSRQQAIPRL